MSMNCPICGNLLEETMEACDLCGYKLTGSTRSFKPVELSGKIENTPVKHASEYFLRVLRGTMVDTIFPLGEKTITIGRSPNCDICLNDMTVSRLHAQIDPEDGGYTIKDLNSFNGVWINNQSVNAHHLKQGDIVQLGKFSLVYQEV
ncbi:MAG: FHA domain-containing protein [Eggerthellaceae bacterium]|nr:FHA domain-containing protein [Eggerthellaceae bacterium]